MNSVKLLLSKPINLILIAASLASIVIGSWYVVHGDISFYTDIARDFLLMNEISDKKVIFVGPRADWKGLFHGPLWLYVNYPAYVLGNGNPLAIGWWWIILTVSSGVGYFFLVSKIFKNAQIGLIFMTLFFLALMTELHRFYNPTGGILIMPLYFFSAVFYYQTRKILYLLLHLFLAGLLLQFQLAVGIPMIMLSFVWVMYTIWRGKEYKHLWAFFILLIPLSSFIIFNLRHNFSYVYGVMDHFSNKTIFESASLSEKISDRIKAMTGSALWFFKGPLGNLNPLLALFLMIPLTKVFYSKEKKYFVMYSFFVFFYVGFFILSFVHSGYVLHHYYLPFITLPFIIFSSAYDHINKKVLYGILLLIIAVNLTYGFNSIKQTPTFINKNLTSWRFLSTMTDSVYRNSTEKDFGLYIYAPDVYGYASKYAVLYAQRTHPGKTMHYHKKQKETFILIEPPPADRKELDGSYWTTNQVKIKSKPVKVIKFDNGYRIEKYVLNKEEIDIPSDTSIDDWISQR